MKPPLTEMPVAGRAEDAASAAFMDKGEGLRRQGFPAYNAPCCANQGLQAVGYGLH